jgi:C1A family cysteine protease
MPRKIQGYGWIPDHPDHRDDRYVAPGAMLRSLPPRVDLRPACPPVYQQGHLGSCTANAVAAAIQFDRMKQGLAPVFTPSRLFIYYNARFLHGTVDADSGVMIRDAIKSVATAGVCPEIMWRYDVAAFRVPPTGACYHVAAWHRAVRYQRLSQDLDQMKTCLASGYPFVFGFTVYDRFESPEVASTGQVPMPSSEEAVVGSHAVLAVGYDETQRWFIIRNSYGPHWGMRGYFTLPYAFIASDNLASDFWAVHLVR